ncbi:MAG: hypothetical protein OWQ54_05430 [Sulfolobaceae archaeon]|nr:hypothetical protein [Sulfolobaceae archaeon]
MKKFFLDSYVISIDDESKLSDIIDFLKEVKLRAYNYKVIFTNNKISVRFIIMPNLILSLEGLSLYKAKEIVNKSEIGNYSIPANIYITFHNVPIKGEFLERVKRIADKLNYYIKIDLFPQDKVEVRMGKLRYVEDSSLQVLASLSDEVLQKLINLECYAGFLTFVDDIFAEILLKCYGVRDLKIIEQIIKSKNYKIKEGQTRGENAEVAVTTSGDKIIYVTKNGFYVNNHKISKGELYKLFTS